MTKTREDLVNLALSLCYADGGSGQSADPVDFQFVDNLVGPVLSTLSDCKIYPYGDPDEIEEAAFIHLAVCLAGSAGMRPDLAKVTKEQVLEAEKILREITAETLSYQPLKGEYF